MDRILVVGGGAKAAALAMKSKVLRELGLGGPSILIVEKNQIGANWSGEFGLTNGRQPLGSSALKDIGYPYDSAFGSEVDQRLFLFSWPIPCTFLWNILAINTKYVTILQLFAPDLIVFGLRIL